MSGIEVFCWGCASQGAVNKVTANLRCVCGSDDIDLYTASKSQLARVASVNAMLAPTAPDFASFMTAASKPVGGDLPGWDAYTGPKPSANQMSNGEGTGDRRCPVCKGGKFDIRDGGPCRECGGDGRMTPTTDHVEPPAVARHNYPSTQTTVPFMGRKRNAGRKSTDPLGSVDDHIRQTTPGADDRWAASPNLKTWEPRPYEHTGAPLPLNGAACPQCGRDHTELMQDKSQEAWWHCPDCGPLSNVDRKPHVDPFNPPEDFAPDGKAFKKATKLWRGKKTGRLMDQIVLIGQTNPGLQPREVLGLARTALSRYPEAR